MPWVEREQILLATLVYALECVAVFGHPTITHTPACMHVRSWPIRLHRVVNAVNEYERLLAEVHAAGLVGPEDLDYALRQASRLLQGASYAPSGKLRHFLSNAAGLLRRAVSYSPRDVGLRVGSAMLQCEYKEDQRCRLALESVLELQPNHGGARANLTRLGPS